MTDAERERETLPPPEEESDERTRDLRRDAYIAGSVNAALAAIESALKRGRVAALGAAAYHLRLAWDDGAAREADLRTAIAVLRAEVDTHRAEVRELHSLLGAIHEVARQQQAEMGALRDEMDALRRAARKEL